MHKELTLADGIFQCAQNTLSTSTPQSIVSQVHIPIDQQPPSTPEVEHYDLSFPRLPSMQSP